MHTHSITELVKAHLKIIDLEILVSKDWASLVEGHRIAIRNSLSPYASSESNILDLKQIPKLDHHGVSISHHHERGGYILSQHEKHLGFDMELNSRVRSELVRRVCSSQRELDTSPNPAALWCAKEACYKSLKYLNQPSGLKDIHIENWQTIQTHIYSCEIISRTHHSLGIVVQLNDQHETWAFFRGHETERNVF